MPSTRCRRKITKQSIIHVKVHSTNSTPNINYKPSDDNYSQTTIYHRSSIQQFPILRLPINSIKQFGESPERVHKERKQKKQRYSLRGLFCILCYIFFLMALAALIVALLTKPEKTTTTIRFRFARLNVNMLINGDGETGACEMGAGVTSPTGWNYNGSITQTSYNNTVYNYLNSTTPGPSDRSNCYFAGQVSTETTMWQTIDLNNYVDPFLIDTQTVRFNLSAWIGGYRHQDDNIVVSLFFQDQYNQTIGNGTSIGPVFATDRGNQTSLLFRQTSGLVPIGTRSLNIWVKIFCIAGPYNNGAVDNIRVFLYS